MHARAVPFYIDLNVERQHWVRCTIQTREEHSYSAQHNMHAEKASLALVLQLSVTKSWLGTVARLHQPDTIFHWQTHSNVMA